MPSIKTNDEAKVHASTPVAEMTGSTSHGAPKTSAASRKLEFHCPVEATVSVIGGKYKAIILYHLSHDDVLRFSQLQRYIPQATPKMLTQQLRELEADGLIARTVYPVVPPKTEYALTDYGETLRPLVDNICDWGRAYIERTGATLVE